MTNTLREDIPNFKAGDVLSISVNVREGQKVRQQLFKGTVIARKGSGIAETITVRKISNGVGVERIFPLHSPSIASIKVDRVNKVRRAKLYYLRDRTGKSARIAEKIKKKIGIDVEVKPEVVDETNVVKAVEADPPNEKEATQAVDAQEDEKIENEQKNESSEQKK